MELKTPVTINLCSKQLINQLTFMAPITPTRVKLISILYNSTELDIPCIHISLTEFIFTEQVIMKYFQLL